MESLLLLIIFGLGAAYFATQNTGTVHLLLGGFLLTSVPLYVVVIGSILLGVLMSWLISIVNSFSVFFTLHGKDDALKKSEKEIEKLRDKNRQLALEIDHLKEKNKQKQEEAAITSQPSLLQHVKQGFGFGTT